MGEIRIIGTVGVDRGRGDIKFFGVVVVFRGRERGEGMDQTAFLAEHAAVVIFSRYE